MILDDAIRELVRAETEPLRRKVEDLQRRLEEVQAVRRLLTVEEFCAEYQGWTVGGVRWLIFHREENGLDAAVYQPSGRRGKMRIDPQKFLEIAPKIKNKRKATRR